MSLYLAAINIKLSSSQDHNFNIVEEGQIGVYRLLINMKGVVTKEIFYSQYLNVMSGSGHMTRDWGSLTRVCSEASEEEDN